MRPQFPDWFEFEMRHYDGQCNCRSSAVSGYGAEGTAASTGRWSSRPVFHLRYLQGPAVLSGSSRETNEAVPNSRNPYGLGHENLPFLYRMGLGECNKRFHARI